MSTTSAHIQTLPATLELAGAPLLQGKLESTEDGRLQFVGVSLAPGQTNAGPLSLRTGARGHLRCATDGPDWKREAVVEVTISGVNGRDLVLQILDTYSPAAKSCLLALSDVPDRQPSGTTGKNTQATVAGPLAEFNRTSRQLLEKRFQSCLDDLRLHLMELTLGAKGGNWSQKHHDVAADAVKNHKKAIAAAFSTQLAEYYRDLTPPASETTAEAATQSEDGALGLVDIDKFEHDLAVERLTKSGSDRFDIPLESLTLRLAELIDADPKRVRLPVHVAQISNAFNKALQEKGIPEEVAADIFDFIDKHLIRELGPYYTQLNSALAKAGILPDIETELREKGSRLRRPQPLTKSPGRQRKQTRPSEDTRLPDTLAEPSGHSFADTQPDAGFIGGGPAPGGSAPGSPAPGSPAPGSPAPGGPAPGGPAPEPQPGSANRPPEFADKLYSSLIQAMTAQRSEALAPSGAPAGAGMEGPANVAPGSTNSGRLADRQAVATALDTLQRDAGARSMLGQGQSLRDYLAENRNDIGALQGTDGMATDTLNQLDMVDNLFDTINTRLSSASEIRPALGNLQIPLAKLSMLEPQFMLDREHAARGVVDAVAQLAATGNFPNKALESRVQDIVDEIVEGYDQDSGVFDLALEKLSKLVSQQERALSRNVERVIRTQEGQEKLRKARLEVSGAIADRVQPPTAPGVLLELIDNGWRDLLVLTHIKEGPDSRLWQEQLVALDVLNGWLAALQDGSVSPTEVASEAEPFLERIAQQLAAALPTHVAYRETLQNLRNTLAGQLPITLREVTDLATEADSGQLRSRVDDLPRLKRWVKRVEELESGCWLSYKDREGVSRRMQLAWISEEKDRFIFVNERGQKNADLSAVQLARQLSRGVQPPAPVDSMGMVDRSMYDTLEQLQKTLSFTRNHDSLTRLINRETFLDQLTRALRHAQTRSSRHAVLYLDIDQFSLVNDLYDRVNGDEVLLEFAKLLAQLHGKKTSSARIEGDEFAVLLLDRDAEQALEFAEKIRGDIEASSVEIEGEQVSFTVSVGIAHVLEHSPSVEEILDSARSAMTKAKQNGRNQVATFSEDQTQAQDFRKEQSRTRQDLEQALETDRFVLRAQPIQQTAVDSGETVRRHYELLLGWRDKSGNVTPPGEFIRSAERYGFMTLVDRWVIKEAFAWISALMDEQKVVPHLSINLSGSSITDNTFMDYLFDQISEFGVGTNRICFEITETGTISNLVKAADFVRAFRNIGCQFSIDDFGTGLASHDFLKELPVDYVKIDGTFIKEIDTNRNDYAMARSINDLAHFLGQQTIAESVENENIIEKLQEIGVDYLQGWGIGKPRPLTEIAGDLSSIEK